MFRDEYTVQSHMPITDTFWIEQYQVFVTRCPHKVTEHLWHNSCVDYFNPLGGKFEKRVGLYMIIGLLLHILKSGTSCGRKRLNSRRKRVTVVSVRRAVDCIWLGVLSFTDCQRHICPPPPPSCWVWFSTSTPTQRTKNRPRIHTDTGERRQTTVAWDHLVPSHLIPSSATGGGGLVAYGWCASHCKTPLHI